MKTPHKLFKTLKARLMVYMLSLLAAMLLMAVIVSAYLNTRALDEQATGYTSQMLTQIQSNIDHIVSSARNIIQYLLEDESVLVFLQLNNFYASEHILMETRARDAICIYMRNNPELIGDILIAGEHSLYVSDEMYRPSRIPLLEESWYKQAMAAQGDYVLLSKPIGRKLQSYRSYGVMDTISLARAIYDGHSRELLGVICMDLQVSVIEEYIRATTLGKDGYVLIIDAAENIVYTPINEIAYRIKPNQLQTRENQLYQIGAKRYQLLSSYSGLTGWRVIGVFNSYTMLEPVKRVHSYPLMMGAGAFLITAMISIWFSSSFTKPIRHIRQLMQKVEKGDLTVSFEAGNDCEEITQMGNNFNAMIGQLHHLMNMKQNLKREVEIKALQAQIKPHFLYNTLDTIHWMAQEHKAQDICMMVSALTKLFRISLSRGHETINLRDELEHVRSYLYIQKVRYEDKLVYSVDCPDELMDCKINKLILQPLVENAIYHGIKQKHSTGYIEIRAREMEDKLALNVLDIGAGMSQHQCDTLNAALREASSKGCQHGYGIFNVNDRIRLTHGSQYGLFYSLCPPGGVQVRVILPLKPDMSIIEIEQSIKEADDSCGN